MDEFIRAMAMSGLLQDLANECEPTELQDLIDYGRDVFQTTLSKSKTKQKQIINKTIPDKE